MADYAGSNLPIGLLLSLGLPIGRLLLRLNNPTEANLIGSMNDFEGLFKAVKDQGDRRELARHIEHISDRVLRRLDRFVRVEFVDLPAGEVEAAATAVAESIMLAGAETLESIAGTDLNAKKLEQFVRREGQLGRRVHDLSEAAEQLAYPLLRESCYELVELARKHPNFTVAALQALLSRSSELRELLTSMDDALDGLPGRIVAASERDFRSQRDHAFDEFSVDYRRAVVSDYDKLELYGIELTRETRRYSLTTAYLSLQLSRADVQGRAGGVGDIDTVLPSNGLLLLQGAAGAGKTTILQWLAVRTALKSFNGSLSFLNEYVPFSIKLRHFADKPLPGFGELAAKTTQSTSLDEPQGWSKGMMQNAKILMLIDGLDEFPDSRRRDLVDWLGRFEELGRRLSIVITSRPSASGLVSEILHLNFAQVASADVLPLDRDQIRSFVLHWHTAIAAQFTGADRAAIEEKAPRVASVLSVSREYRLLASSPLLCAVLSALFHLRRGVLPNRRVEIYDTLLGLLLGDRDVQKGVPTDVNVLSASDRRLLLEDIADFFLTNELSEAPHNRILDVVTRSRIAAQFGDHTPAEILKHLLARSGVLRSPAAGLVDFVHRTFLEYLGARAQIRQDHIEALARNVRRPTWNEAVILAAGVGIERQVESLVEVVLSETEDLLRTKQLDDAANAERHLLTVTCASFLETAVLLKPSLRERIIKVITWIVPPDSAEGARACASAGNILLPHLASALGNDAITHRALGTSISTLAEIGTPEALSTLGNIPVEKRVAAIRELVSAWSWFEPGDFAQTVLADIEPQEPVVVPLPNSTLLPYIGALSQNIRWDCDVEVPEESLYDHCGNVSLRRFSIANVDILKDARCADGEFLWQLRQAESISVSGIRSLISPPDASLELGRHVRELSLHLVGGGIVEPDVWAALPKLEILQLLGAASVGFTSLPTSLVQISIAGDITSIAPLAGALPSLRRLEWLGTQDVDLLVDLVAAAPNLRELHVASVSGVTDLDFTAGCDKLEIIELSHLSDLEDISTLLRLEGLSEVRITGEHDLRRSQSLITLWSRLAELEIEDMDLEVAIVNDSGRWSRDDESIAEEVDPRRVVDYVNRFGDADLVKDSGADFEED